MAQRVAFAAATAASAPVLIADKPTKGLDAERSDRVISLLAEWPNQGGALVAITHEASVARQLGGNIMVLKSGKLVESGTTEKVLTNLRATYTQQLLNAEPQSWSKQPAANCGELLLCAKELCIWRGNKCLLKHFNIKLHDNERVAMLFHVESFRGYLLLKL